MKAFLVSLSTTMMLLAPAGVTLAHAQAASVHRVLKGHGHVYADGRCRGISYGTGARSCGTATGGPVGGLSSRN